MCRDLASFVQAISLRSIPQFRNSNGVIEDASFIRLNTVSLYYDFSSIFRVVRVKLQTVRVLSSGQNLINVYELSRTGSGNKRAFTATSYDFSRGYKLKYSFMMSFAGKITRIEICFSLSVVSSCESFVDVDLTETLVTSDKVFSNDVTATSAVTGMYHRYA